MGCYAAARYQAELNIGSPSDSNEEFFPFNKYGSRSLALLVYSICAIATDVERAPTLQR
jgi:hypothetical protein